MGLRADGTAVAAGDDDLGQCAVGTWRDVVAVAAGSAHTIGLRADGTVVAAGEGSDGRCDVDGWTLAVTAPGGSSGARSSRRGG